MIPLAVLDILAEDWVNERKASAQRYGTRPSRTLGWLASLRRKEATPAQAAPVTVVAPRRSNRAA